MQIKDLPAPPRQEIRGLSIVLLRMGALLQSNGASTARIRLITDRVAGAYGYQADLFVTHRALNITVSDATNEKTCSLLKRVDPPGVNFSIVAGISRISWQVKKEGMSVEQLDEALKKLEGTFCYSHWFIALLVSIAGGCFCGLAGGSIWAMGVAALATCVGFNVRHLSTKAGFNSYLCVFLAAFTATLVAGVFRKFVDVNIFETAFATSVLFLIPGVPFINSFTDFLDGNILNGLVRLCNSLIFSFMIALGLICSILAFQF